MTAYETPAEEERATRQGTVKIGNYFQYFHDISNVEYILLDIKRNRNMHLHCL